jgi:putative endonuclease
MEDAAARYLRAAGLKIIARNYHCRYGEIDLIARDGNTVVFVEVRYRRNNHFGSASMSVDRRKQRKLLATANSYLLVKKLDCPCRFDVIAIEGVDKSSHEQTASIEWIVDAFGQ